MKSLFDRFAPTLTSFRPKTAGELFALRLAQKLSDNRAVRHYVALLPSHTEAQLAAAYRKVVNGSGSEERGRVFLQTLDRLHVSGSHDRVTKLISVRIERRAIAAAIFTGTHLEYADTRQLSSVREKAEASAVGFVNWILSRFPVESAAVETIDGSGRIQRRVLHDAIRRQFRERMLALWEISQSTLKDGCGHPALQTRADLREVATSIWPILHGTHAKVFVQDAAILGLYVQIERRFITN